MTHPSRLPALLKNPLVILLAEHAVLIGLIVRLFLAWFLPWLMDDGKLLPEVSYTDIDFYVFTDAARYIQLGQSPFDRHTYRYTPFLAELLAHLPHREVGRHLFCVADALCGWIIVQFRRKARRNAPQNNVQVVSVSNKEQTTWELLQDGLWWCYNPLAINICTRGSSESLMVLLPVLLTVWLVSSSSGIGTDGQPRRPDMVQAVMAGVSHGIAIHSKLYPIIYTLSFMAYLSTRNDPLTTKTTKTNSFPWTEPLRLVRLIGIWVSRLFQPVPLLFMCVSLLTFAGLTYLAVLWYGEIALQEGLLYHFSRVDHRHNYSMYWYWIYLARARMTSNLQVMGRILLLPQVVLLVYSSLGLAPFHLGLAIFVQTFLFVTHNKVITAQYFTWYLCLLPLCTDVLRLTVRVQRSVVLLLFSIGIWLGSAYCLEMQGMAVHKWVWCASVLFFLANVNLLGALLRSTSESSSSLSVGATGRGTSKKSD
jgi:phosphatidylinositol glycan class M